MSVDIPRIIPIFPLPNVVLFPKIHLPLHIFELRYREMVRDVLSGDCLIGMALLKEGWERDYDQNPEIYVTGCVGKITHCQALGDGRFNIILSGIIRFSIIEEFFNKSYRQAWVEPPTPNGHNPTLLAKNRMEIQHLIQNYFKPQTVFSQLIAMLDHADDETLIHALSASLNLTPLEKQFLLESEDLNQQCRRLLEIVKLQNTSLFGREGIPQEQPCDPGGEP